MHFFISRWEMKEIFPIRDIISVDVVFPRLNESTNRIDRSASAWIINTGIRSLSATGNKLWVSNRQLAGTHVSATKRKRNEKPHSPFAESQS
ncbi:hypothetical protein CDAR_399011 [Caerostris darwini]|uniref:Uncharacterized protein n=1 Tax=Caerostris darwini TaxID=1538125 RepID=A0AAV4VXX9_9ARAC|nr:hypothetical protein CDAR_399011 [Caerostris darwini]